MITPIIILLQFLILTIHNSNLSELLLKSKSNLVIVAKKIVSKLQLSRDLSDTSTLMKRGKTLLSNTKWNTRLRCAGIGSCLESASSKIIARSHMETMNFIKKPIFLLTTKPSCANSFTQLPIVLMATGANSYIHSMTYLTQNQLIILWCFLKTPGYHMKELFH